jgi:phosphoglycerate-specific signal transduction histidine kinase
LAARFPSPRNNYTASTKQSCPPKNGIKEAGSTKANGLQENTAYCNLNSNPEKNKIDNIVASHIDTAVFTENGTTALVEGLPDGLVQDAVLVARAVAENIHIANYPTTDLGELSQAQSFTVSTELPILATELSNTIHSDLAMPSSLAEQDNINLNSGSLVEEQNSVSNATSDVTKNVAESTSKSSEAECHTQNVSVHANVIFSTGHASHDVTSKNSNGIGGPLNIQSNHVSSPQAK